MICSNWATKVIFNFDNYFLTLTFLEIVLLRQLFPRILKNLGGGYWNSLDSDKVSKEICKFYFLKIQINKRI